MNDEPQHDSENLLVPPDAEPNDTAADALAVPDADVAQPEDDVAATHEIVEETPTTQINEATPAEEAPLAETQTDEPTEAIAEPLEQADEEEGPVNQWFILKVQSNREEAIRDGLLRRVKIEGLEPFFGDIIVPTETFTEFKGGKRRIVKRKLYPGYIVVNMQMTDDTWYLVRETPGVGDFTGSAGRPSPMQPHEVARILAEQEEKEDEAPKLQIAFSVGDRVKVNDGIFESYEGDVDSIDETNGRVTVMLNVFGRSTPVEFDYGQVETV